MWRDFHVIAGRSGWIVFFPESARVYSVPEPAGRQLRAFLDGSDTLPPEAEPMLRKEMDHTAVSSAVPDGDDVTSLCLYTAHNCNLACSYCYNQRGRAVKPLAMMAPATAHAALDRFFVRPDVDYAVAFYGGEPLLNPRVIETTVGHAQRLRAERGVRISFSLTTNGTVMSPPILELLRDHFSSVTVSLDGIKPVNDRHRRYEHPAHASVHDQAVETLRRLKSETSLRVTVKGTLTAQGLPHYRESLAYLRSLGADAVALDPAFGPAEAGWALDGANFERYVELIGCGADRLCEPGDGGEPWHEYVSQILAGLIHKRRLRRHCNAGRDPAVMADGSLYACHGLAGIAEFSMGRVDDPASTDFARVRETFRSLDVRHVDECRACWARHLCGGSCYANGYFRAGSVARPDPMHCTAFRRVAEKTIAAFAEVASRPEPAKFLAQRVRRMTAAAVPASHV
jgi:uncharacterized protein